jgi:hypothetical protein
MGTRINDQDVVITPVTQRKIGADLGFLSRIVLSTAQERLGKIVFVARAPNFAVFDAPNLMLREGKHRPVLLRYAVLVEEGSGKLETLLWLLDRKGDDVSGPVGPLQWLPPGKVEDCVLHVDAGEFTLGNPNEQSFALQRLPQGRNQFDCPDALRPAAARPRFTPALAGELDSGLRALLKDAARR